MSSPLTATFEYSDDLARAAARESVTRQFGLLGFGLLASLAAGTLLWWSDANLFWKGMAFGFMAGVALFLASAYSAVGRAVRFVRQVPDRKIVVLLDETHIHFQNWAGESKFVWAGVSQAIMTKRFKTLVFGKAGRGSAQIPNVAMSPQFRAALLERIRAAGGRVVA